MPPVHYDPLAPDQPRCRRDDWPAARQRKADGSGRLADTGAGLVFIVLWQTRRSRALRRLPRNRLFAAPGVRKLPTAMVRTSVGPIGRACKRQVSEAIGAGFLRAYWPSINKRAPV